MGQYYRHYTMLEFAIIAITSIVIIAYPDMYIATYILGKENVLLKQEQRMICHYNNNLNCRNITGMQ